MFGKLRNIIIVIVVAVILALPATVWANEEHPPPASSDGQITAPNITGVNPDPEPEEGNLSEIDAFGSVQQQSIGVPVSSETPPLMDVALQPSMESVGMTHDLAVPMRFQDSLDVSCGVQALGMAMDYLVLGEGQGAAPRSEELLTVLSDGGLVYEWGTGIEELAYLARQQGYTGSYSFHDWTLGQVRAQLDQGRPVVVSLGTNGEGNPGHFVTVTGISEDGQWVSYNDPAEGKITVPVSEFLMEWSWQGYAGVVTQREALASEADPMLPVMGMFGALSALTVIASQQPWRKDVVAKVAAMQDVLSDPERLGIGGRRRRGRRRRRRARRPRRPRRPARRPRRRRVVRPRRKPRVSAAQRRAQSRRRAAAASRARAQAAARRRAQAAARARAHAAARRRAKAEARRRAAAEAQRREQARRQAALLEAKRRKEAEARRKAQEEARRRAEEKARREEQARRQAALLEAQRKAEAKAKAEEEARRRAATALLAEQEMARNAVLAEKERAEILKRDARRSTVVDQRSVPMGLLKFLRPEDQLAVQGKYGKLRPPSAETMQKVAQVPAFEPNFSVSNAESEMPCDVSQRPPIISPSIWDQLSQEDRTMIATEYAHVGYLRWEQIEAWFSKYKGVAEFGLSLVPFLGDGFGLFRQGINKANGEKVDRLDLTLSIVGLIMDLPLDGVAGDLAVATLKGLSASLSPAFRDVLAEALEFGIKNPGELSAILLGVKQLVTNKRLVATLADHPDALGELARLGSEAVDLLIKNVKNPEDIVPLINRYGKKVVEALDNGFIRVGKENVEELAQELAEATGKKVWSSAISGAIYVQESAPEAIDAAKQLVDLVKSGTASDDQIQAALKKLSEITTHGSSDRLVLGSFAGDCDGYIQEALDSGGNFFDVGDDVWDILNKNEVDFFKLNEQVVRNQIASGGSIEYTLRGITDKQIPIELSAIEILRSSGGSEDAVEAVAKLLDPEKRKFPYRMKEVRLLIQNGYDFKMVGNTIYWTKDLMNFVP